MLAPAHADVTIKATTTGKGLGMSGTMPNVSYIKGQKMRVETALDKKTRSRSDVGTRRCTLDTMKMEAEVWDMATFSQELSAPCRSRACFTTLDAQRRRQDGRGQNVDG